jgi:hypothetical protein
MMDVQSASIYLAASAFPLIRHGEQWLNHWEDPTDLLFALAGEASQSLGPFETFRICAFMGLGPAPAVQDLGYEVLQEPPEQTPRLNQTISHALALAHAHDLWPEKNAPFGYDIVRQLALSAESSEQTKFLAAMGLLALIGKGGLCPDPNASESLLDTCFDEIAQLDPAVRGAMMLEISFLNQDMYDLREAAQQLLREAQNQDGSFLGPAAPRFDNELATLRNLALFQRCERSAPQP